MAENSDSSIPSARLERATKRFHRGTETVEALREANLVVEPGEFVAVMGASGSGKSTLLHAMAGLTQLDEGTAVIEGQDLSTLSDRRLTLFRRRRVGLIFQAFNLIPALTAEENVGLPLVADGRDSAEVRDRARGLLERLGVAHRRDHRPDAMSGGEQQRVAIARALATEPAVVLADEPTGSLDSITGQTICMLLKDLSAERGRAVVVVTHEPAVAVWASRVALMRDGAVVAEFPTADFPDAHALAAHYHDVVAAAVPEATH